jgi:hypothetical protein
MFRASDDRFCLALSVVDENLCAGFGEGNGRGTTDPAWAPVTRAVLFGSDDGGSPYALVPPSTVRLAPVM